LFIALSLSDIDVSAEEVIQCSVIEKMIIDDKYERNCKGLSYDSFTREDSSARNGRRFGSYGESSISVYASRD
jgi:hypothetical protein